MMTKHEIALTKQAIFNAVDDKEKLSKILAEIIGVIVDITDYEFAGKILSIAKE